MRKEFTKLISVAKELDIEDQKIIYSSLLKEIAGLRKLISNILLAILIGTYILITISGFPILLIGLPVIILMSIGLSEIIHRRMYKDIEIEVIQLLLNLGSIMKVK